MALTVHEVQKALEASSVRVETYGVTIISTASTFNVDVSNVYTPSSITLTGIEGNIYNLPTYTWEYSLDNNDSAWFTIIGEVTDTLVVTSALYDSIYTGSTFVKFRLTVSQLNKPTVQSTYTIFNNQEAADGESAVSGYLTRETYLVATDSAGVIPVGGLTSAGGTFRVFEGTTEKTNTASVAYSIIASTGLTASIGATSGVYTISGMSAVTGTVTFRAIYNGIVTIDKQYTITKATAGTPANKYATATLYQWSTTEPTIAPSGTSVYTWSTGASSAYTPTGGGSWEVTVPTNPGTSGIRLWTVSKAVTDVATAVATMVTWAAPFVISAVSANGTDGETGPAGVKYANPTVYRWEASLPTGPSGTPTYDWSTGLFGAAPTNWTLEPGAGAPGQTLWGATVSIIDATGATTTSFNWTNASITARGYQGLDGESGTSAKMVTLTTTNFLFKESSTGVVTPSSISITASPQNLTGTPVWSTEPAITLGGLATDTTRTISNTNFGANNSVKVTVVWGGVTDSLTINRVVDGATGTAGTNARLAFLTNETHSVPANSDGSSPVLTNSGTTIFAYDGTTALQYETGTTAPTTNGRFRVTAISAVGVTAGTAAGALTVSGTGGVMANITAMSADVGTITYTINTRNNGVNQIFTKVQTFSKVRQGAIGEGTQGISARRAYVVTTAVTLPPTPNNPTIGINSVPADGSFGASGWSTTPPALVNDGDRLFQSDGLYNPVTDQIIWEPPYLSSLKVGSLSAITANLGTITAGNITFDSSSFIKGGASTYSSATGIWMGYDSTAYKFRIGNPTGARLQWNGSSLQVYDSGNNLTINAGAPVYEFISGKPASLSDINGTEGTKLTGIAAGATVGAPAGTTVGGTLAETVASNAANGNTAFTGTSVIRGTSAPTNAPTGVTSSEVATVDGNIVVTVSYTYTQGAIPADLLLVFVREGGGTIVAADPAFSTNPVTGSMTFTLKPSTGYSLGVQAIRTAANGITYGTTITTVTRTTGAGNYTGTVAGTAAATLVSNASSALSGLTDKLNKAAADTLTGPITLSAANAIQVGTATDGIYIGSGGIVAKAGNVNKFVIQSNGNATFYGELSAATGSFSGTVSGGTILGGSATGYAVGTGIFSGLDSSVYKFRVGIPGQARVVWDGTNFNIYNSSNQLTLSSGGAVWNHVTGKPTSLSGLDATAAAELAAVESTLAGFGANLLQNSSFELYTGTNGVADGWLQHHAGTTSARVWSVDATRFTHGNKSQKVTGTVGGVSTANRIGIATEYLPLPTGSAGTRFTFSCRVSATVGTSVGAYAVFRDAAYTWLNTTQPSTAVMTGVDDFIEIVGSTLAHASATQVQVWVFGYRTDAGGPIEFYVDQVQLQQGYQTGYMPPDLSAATQAVHALADAAQAAADAAQLGADGANALLTDIASDSKLTPVEKQQTKIEWDGIVAMHGGIQAQADALSVSRTAYDASYSALSSYITGLLSNLTETSNITGSVMRSTFANFYSARQALLNAISNKASKLATWASVSGAGKPEDNATKGTDIIADADLANDSYWTVSGGTATWETPPTSAWRGVRTLKLDGSSGAWTSATSPAVSVKGGDSIRLSYQGQVLAGTGGVHAQLMFSASSDMSSPSYYNAGQNTSSSITEKDGYATVPATARYMKVQLVKANTGATSVRIGGLIVRPIVGKITSSNVSTYIDSAAIGWAQIGNLDINANGYLRSVKPSYGSSTAGIYLDYNGGTPRLDIGNSTKYLRWSGSDLLVGGDIIADGNIKTNAVTTDKIQTGAVTAAKITANGLSVKNESGTVLLAANGSSVPPWVTSVAASGTGISLVESANTSTNTAELRTLAAGDGINIAVANGTVTVSSRAPASTLYLSSDHSVSYTGTLTHISGMYVPLDTNSFYYVTGVLRVKTSRQSNGVHIGCETPYHATSGGAKTSFSCRAATGYGSDLYRVVYSDVGGGLGTYFPDTWHALNTDPTTWSASAWANYVYEVVIQTGSVAGNFQLIAGIEESGQSATIGAGSYLRVEKVVTASVAPPGTLVAAPAGLGTSYSSSDFENSTSGNATTALTIKADGTWVVTRTNASNVTGTWLSTGPAAGWDLLFDVTATSGSVTRSNGATSYTQIGSDLTYSVNAHAPVNTGIYRTGSSTIAVRFRNRQTGAITTLQTVTLEAQAEGGWSGGIQP